MSIAEANDVRTYHWTVEEYEKLGEQGFFRDRKVELLNGEIYEMSPIGFRHAEAVTRLNEFFMPRAKGRYRVRIQLPILLDPQSMPEPDISLINIATPTLSHHPKTEHIYLAIEVSLSTLGFDRGDKKETYALRGISEYWLLNLQDNVMEIYRDPIGSEYRNIQLLHPADTASPLNFPDLKLRVGDFIP